MRQQDLIIKQLAQKIANFIEPVITYLVIGSKKAAEEACNKVGSEVWETEKKLWEKLCSIGCIELKEAAGDMVVAPSDTDVRQVFTQEILKLLEGNPDLVKEVSSFMDYKTVQKLMTEDSSARITKQALEQGSKQTLLDRTRVLDEFNGLLEAFISRENISKSPERYGMPATEKSVTGLGVVGEKSHSDLRIEQIAEIKHITKRF